VIAYVKAGPDGILIILGFITAARRRNSMGLISQILAFFEAQSALANLIQIGTPVILVALALIRYVRRRVSDPSTESMTAWVTKHFGDAGRTLSNRAISSLPIAVIDDEPGDFPIDYLRSLGYRVTVFPQFEIANVSSLVHYDLIVLDIAGVMPEDARRGGLQLIKKIKQLMPSPIVIAVSGKRYDPTVTEFFQLADAQLKKPVGSVEFEDAVRALLATKVSPLGIATRIDAELANGIDSEKQRRSICRNVIKAVQGQITPERAVAGAPDSARQTLELLLRNLLRMRPHYEVA
jgi:DNA-binding response OmpR family regulator